MSDIIDLQHLEKYKENNRIEAKKAMGGLPKSLWETYSAFANTLGGVLLLGVEELPDKSFYLHDLPDPQRLVDEFWSILSDKRHVSANILTRDQVKILESGGRNQIAIIVPRAERREKPVYLELDKYTGSYRRNGEGDYHCTREEIDAMLRDASEEGQDSRILEAYSGADLCAETIVRYRQRFREIRPGHLWADSSQDVFLEKADALKIGTDGTLHPTLAGLLMFGKETVICRELPCYFLDYQEKNCHGVWEERLVSDSGEWSGNLYDFFCRVYRSLSRGIRLSFPEGDLPGKHGIITPVHQAIQEALANCLTNADYQGKQGVMIQKEENNIYFENPGSFRIGQERVWEGGISDPRNPALIRMFHLINVGNGGGAGLAGIYRYWRRQGWKLPKIREEFNPDRSILSLTIKKENGTEEKSADKDTFLENSQQAKACQKRARKLRRSITEVDYESQKQQVIDYVTTAVHIRTKETAKLLNISPNQAKQVLARMVDEEILVRRGRKRNRTYQLKA